MHAILRFIPKNHLSRLAGSLASVHLPFGLSRFIATRFARAYGINLDEAAHPLAHYATLGELFTRDLLPGARPIEGQFVSPVDGRLREWGRVERGRIPQVKGKTYDLIEFLGGDDIATTFDQGLFFNFYLSPRDYHHIHSPARGLVARSVHIPGMLWPVNDWSLSSIDDLFSINERVVTYLKTRFGVIAVVMVGATNVGKMTVTYDDFVTNVPPREKNVRTRNYGHPVVLRAGDRLGTFHMGSSVVVLVRQHTFRKEDIIVEAPGEVRLGQRLVEADSS